VVNKDEYIKSLNELADIPEEDSSRLIQAAGIISEYIKNAYDIDLIVVGGLSVEVYTGGGYMTQDIDFVGVNHEKIIKGLTDLGFRRLGKDSVHDDLNIYVEVPSSVLEGSEERVRQIVTDGKHNLFIIGIDDIIIDRLRALVQWDEKIQEEWIFLLIRNYIDELDLNYIKDKLTNTEKERFNHFLELVKEENDYARMQFELANELDKKHVPFSIVEAEELKIISIPSKSGSYYGLSLSPIVMGYTYEEDENGGDTFFAVKSESMKIDELLRWLQSLAEEDINKKNELIQTVEQVLML